MSDVTDYFSTVFGLCLYFIAAIAVYIFNVCTLIFAYRKSHWFVDTAHLINVFISLAFVKIMLSVRWP